MRRGILTFEMCYSIWNLVNKIYVVHKIPCGLFTWHVSPKEDRYPWKRDVNWTYIRRSVRLTYSQFSSCVQGKVSLAFWFPYCILIVFLVHFDCFFLSWGAKTPIFGWRHTQAISCLNEFLRFIYFWDLFLSNWSWPNSFVFCAFFIIRNSSYRLIFPNSYKNLFWIRSANFNFFDISKLY